MTLWYKLTNAGTRFAEYPSERRSILLSNLISLILFTLGFILFTFNLRWFGWTFITLAIPCIALLCLFPILLNHLNFSTVSRVWLCVFLPLATISLSLYTKSTYSNAPEELDYFTFRFIILSSCVFPAIFFSFRDKALLILTTLAELTILLLFDPLHNVFNVGHELYNNFSSSYSFLNVIVFISFIILSSAVLFLKWESEKNEDKAETLLQELNQINEELVEKSNEIEAQHQEISAQTENLNANQVRLQQAYKIIEEHKDLLVKQNKNLTGELITKNQELTEANDELIKHNNELRQFSFTVSHNLRGPVASLIGLLKLIDNNTLSENHQEIFSHLENSTHRLDNIIKDLGKIIDIRHDIFQIRQKVSLKNAIQEILEVLDVKSNNIRVIQYLRCDMLYSIKPMVHSILYNLISNAIKYRSSERESVIEISAREQDNFYIIEVKDNGLGIDLSRNKENLFKLYKRFHFHTEGKGLGLYLVKLQTEALGGSIQVDSEINRYTMFTVNLKKPANAERQLLYKQPYADIFYDANLNCIGTIWHGPITSEQYRSAFKKCLEFVKSYNTPNYFVDLTTEGPIDKQDQLWMFNHILPEATRNGLRRIAAVRPDAASPQIKEYLNGINENLIKLGALQKYFFSMQEAFDWLQEENEKGTLNKKA